MLKFAANLTMMFNEVPFIERFSAAAEAGFQGVEFLFPYQYDADELQSIISRQGLTTVLFNAPPGQWQQGERGLASLPDREHDFRDSIEQVIYYANILDCRQVHIMAGNIQPELAPREQQAQFIKRLSYAADRLLPQGVRILIEPINPVDMPDYFLKTLDQAQQIIHLVNKPNIAIQFDIYHCQRTQGNILNSLEKHINNIGHIQIASAPDRHEPDNGEINYPWLLEKLERINYHDWIGCEYYPAGNTAEGLSWLHKINHNLSKKY